MASEAQKRASKNYKKRHPEKRRIYTYRSNARTFIRKYATLEEVDELRRLLDERQENLLNKEKH